MRVLAILIVFFVAGCGYHVPGSSESWVGGKARVLHVKLFVNQTAEPYLENFFTDALVAELARSRFVKLTEDVNSAEVQLSGNIEAFSSTALAHASTDQISDYRALMRVSARLVQKNSSDLLWQQKMERSEDYIADADKNRLLEDQRLAAKEIAKRLAEDVCASLLNNF